MFVASCYLHFGVSALKIILHYRTYLHQHHCGLSLTTCTNHPAYAPRQPGLLLATANQVLSQTWRVSALAGSTSLQGCSKLAVQTVTMDPAADSATVRSIFRSVCSRLSADRRSEPSRMRTDDCAGTNLRRFPRRRQAGLFLPQFARRAQR